MISDQKTKLFINEMLELKKSNIEYQQEGQQNKSPTELLRSMNIVIGVDINLHNISLQNVFF